MTADDSTAYHRVLDALRDAGLTVKPSSNGHASAQCPAHDDTHPSLSVKAIEGSALLHCHAGCDWRDVLAALTLTPAALFDDPSGATYHYPDNRIVCRSPTKQFTQRGNTKGTALFHADRIADTKTVYVVEGEKDVLAVESVGAAAVCSAMGAGKAKGADWSPLKGKQVVIVADDDTVGYQHAQQICALLDGIAGECRIVKAVEGKDVSDHIASGHTLDELAPADRPHWNPHGDNAIGWHAMTGAAFILDAPPVMPSQWGDGQHVLWPVGEPFMIASSPGVGKTTLAGQVIRAQLGIGSSDVLGLTVAQTSGNILYLAMDRPPQISRSMQRQYTEDDRNALQRLVIRTGPPITDLAKDTTLLTRMADYYQATIVYVDSLKDAAIGLTEDEVGAAYNRARQHLTASGVQLCDLHHTRKAQQGSGQTKQLADIYGSTWLTAGSGSVILLVGDAGDLVIGFEHVKPPAETIGPLRLVLDPDTGTFRIDTETDLLHLVERGRADGLTAHDGAQQVYGVEKPTKAQVERIRRRLDEYVSTGKLVRFDGERGGGEQRCPATWFQA
ncbi:AAA family ATPase [Mycobacterium sp. OTB74]|uniref:AAA family ATPase n=1 Tax=Mycobacterium sp. OTB74 TaxID=1853452 RepID=UPI002473D3F5|nr:AAA family ATPase [Mycobacterium sp. OTB74]MDH6248001.1 5S rRNA maturation endonuclease (ribonuclease M5) [Mycobacterium sp. OTB74]